jgi:predicted phage tail protein
MSNIVVTVTTMPPSSTKVTPTVRSIIRSLGKASCDKPEASDNKSTMSAYDKIISEISNATSKTSNEKSLQSLQSWLSLPLDREHHYTPQYEGKDVYLTQNNDIDHLGDLTREREVLSLIEPVDMDASQQRLARGIQTFKNGAEIEQLLIDPATVHGHVARLFQEMNDVAMDMDSVADHAVVVPVVSPAMKSAFYRFCRLYTSTSVIAKIPIDLQ